MDILVEQEDSKNGRKVFQYFDKDGKPGRLVSKRQHILDLKGQGKLAGVNVDEISFSFKRKRSISFDVNINSSPAPRKKNDKQADNDDKNKRESLDADNPTDDVPARLPAISGTEATADPKVIRKNTSVPGQFNVTATVLVTSALAVVAGDEAKNFTNDVSVEAKNFTEDASDEAKEFTDDEPDKVVAANSIISTNVDAPTNSTLTPNVSGDNEGKNATQLKDSNNTVSITLATANAVNTTVIESAGKEASGKRSAGEKVAPVIDAKDVNSLPVKAKNEILKKETAIGSLKVSADISALKEVCVHLEKLRIEEDSRSFVITGELKQEMIEILTEENASPFLFFEILSSSQGVRDFFLNEIIQEAMNFGSQKTVLKLFPPDLTTNFCQSLVQEMSTKAPNLLSLLVKFCCKTNEPITEKQVRKTVQLASQLTSCLNQKNSSLQKLISLKLKLSSITNSGLDFLHDVGVTQSSRSLQRDQEYLASISRDCIIEELRDTSFSFLVDNLDKVVNGTLVHFTSVILVADRKKQTDLSKDVESPDDEMFEPNYLKLCEEDNEKYLSAAVFIIGKLLAKVAPRFDWITDVIGDEYQHELSEYSNKKTFWSYIALLPLSEQKNSEMVEVLDFLNELSLEIFWKTAEEPEVVKDWIETVRNPGSSDMDVELAQSKLSALAEAKGLPSVIGDLLTYERAFVAMKLRSGSITGIERFDLMKFRLAMFHEKMAKIRRDYSTFLPSLTNTLDKGNLAFFRARLSKHDITNDGDKIKKDGNFEKHLDFFSSIAEESLKSALKNHFSQQDEVATDDKNIQTLKMLVSEFMDSNNIVLNWDPKSREEPFDDLHKYHSRIVSSHLMNKIHHLFSKFGDGQGLRIVNRIATSYFLNAGGSRSKYAKYSYKDNVCHDSSSACQKQRNDLSSTVNAWGGPHSVDCDQFQEHRIKNLKGFLDSLHGNLDPTTVERAVKSADLELKICAEMERSMNISYRGPSSSSKFLTDEEVVKVARIMGQIKPFSTDREPVVFVEPLEKNNNFSRLDSDPDLVRDFLWRNKEEYSGWGPFV